MRMAGALLDMTDEARRVLMHVMVIDAAKRHVVAATGAMHIIAVDDAADPLMEGGPAFRAAHLYLDVVDGVMHGVRSFAFEAAAD
jgi:hypothetical protein